ncbi:hypothetical protein BH23CHL2_BH23CHL2_15240 [soil metagenome]
MSTVQMLDVDIQLGTLIRAKPERVWEALTTSDGVNQWFTTGAKWTHEIGSPMCWRWENWGPYDITTDSVGEILDVDPYNRFSFNWANGSGETPSTVTMRFEPVEGGTKVELTDSGYPDTPEGRHALMDCSCGWGEALTLVKFFVEHGVTY